jgi:seryl-tRNA synthetase
MKEMSFKYDVHKDVKELTKLISFLSSDIIDYEFCNDTLHLYLKDCADENKISNDFDNLFKNYLSVSGREEVIYENKQDISFTPHSEILRSEYIHKYADGVFSFTGDILKLFKYFSSSFLNLALKLNSYEKLYPTLLPVEFFKKTSYIKSSPQHVMFCCDIIEGYEFISNIASHLDADCLKDDLSMALFTLSPAACFHSYIEYENRRIDRSFTLTFEQKVFRNEGRFNWDGFGRLRDYTVREIVFFGDDEYVRQQRKRAMDLSVSLLQAFNLNGQLISSSDPFIIPEMQRYKKVQVAENSKYELKLSTGADNLACASFNLHGGSFTKPFDIHVNDFKTVSGCVGFGIERWVLAFLAQHGLDSKNWPIKI